jgi:CheY-like chemotaxis protein
MADDDKEDCSLMEEALREARLANDLHFVHDGEQLMDYLRRRGSHGDAPRPGLILLDLNMPRKDGREALIEIKADPALRRILVVVLTTSRATEDVAQSYDLGISGFVVKPVTIEAMAKTVATVGCYWLEIVELPTS